MMNGNWGFNKIEKYNEEYFLEEGKEVDTLCPFSKPSWCKCPHYTQGNPVHEVWNAEPAIYINESKIEFKIPDNIILDYNEFRTYYYTGIETAREIIKSKDMLKTNYIPLIVKNFYVDGKQYRFLDLLLPEVQKIGRSIILETNGVKTPVPGFVRRLGKNLTI